MEKKISEKKVVVDGLTLKLLRKDNAGCQFIDTNNNGEAVLDWLVLYELGVPTGRYAASGHCMYPEVDFYRSKRFMQQKEFCDRYFNFVD